MEESSTASRRDATELSQNDLTRQTSDGQGSGLRATGATCRGENTVLMVLQKKKQLWQSSILDLWNILFFFFLSKDFPNFFWGGEILYRISVKTKKMMQDFRFQQVQQYICIGELMT